MKQLKTLIIEDSEDDVFMLVRHLRKNGYEVTYERVENAGQMRRALEEQSWQIILSDYSLPHFNGLAALEVLKATGLDVPFIMISGTIGEDTAVQAMLAGADDYFIKGNLGRLVPAIERELHEAENRRARREAETRLRESEEHLNALMRSVEAIVWEADAETFQFTYVSEPAERLLGYPLARWYEPDFWADHIHPEDREAAIRFCVTSTQGQRDHEFEYRMIAADGRNVWMRDIVSVVKENDRTAKLRGIIFDITERKEAEEKIRISEENYRALTQASTQFVWTADAEGRSDELFQWFSELTGFAATSVEDIIELMHPEDYGPARAAWLKALRQKTVFTRICRFRTNAGEYRYLATRSIPMFDADGSFRQWVGTFNDITERMNAEEALRESEELNRAVLNSMLANIAVVDSFGKILAVNDSWRVFAEKNCRQDGVVPAEPGANYLSVTDRGVGELSEEDAGLVSDSMRKVINGEADSFSLEYPCHTSDGERRWFLMNVAPLKTKAGGAVIAHTEITAQKFAEDALRKSEFQLRIITDTVPAQICYVDDGEKVRFANRAAAEWFGRSIDEIVTLRLDALFGEELYRELQPELKNVYEGREITYERSVLALDNSSRFVRVTYIPDFDASGRVIGFFSFVIDLTESKRAEERLRKSEEQLRQAQKLESVGRLAGGIAHDFNNMLTAINGYSDLTLRRLEKDNPLRRNVEEIKKAGERSAALTQQLLAFSRLQILQVKKIDINQVITDSIVMLQRLIGEDIHVVSVLNPKLDPVESDPGQISQLILNLAVNARDAMPQGGTISIETDNVYLDEEFAARHESAKPGHYALLAVSDTGTGIDEETQQHIFEPFFTTKAVGKGTGLGLSTVYGIVKQSNGIIVLKSTVGKGTTFEIYLPSVNQTAAAGEKPAGAAHPNRGHERILLVEDEDIVRDLSRQILQSCGYEVIEAEDGLKALEICRANRHRIDLVITDVVMPQMSGGELVEKIMEMEPGIKILFTSGYTGEQILHHGFIEGAANFIQKPFTFEKFARKVREILDMQKT